MRSLKAFAAAAAVSIGLPAAAYADLGHPVPWQINLQSAATPVMENIRLFHDGLLILITLITLFVLALLIYVMVKFNAKANPTPSRNTHNTFVEVVWTVVPVLILIGVAIPSFRLLYFQRDIPQADMTLKATGNTWFWSYEYPDHENVSFDAYLKENGQPRLLETDNPVVVPVNKIVRLIVTSNDVIHAWTIPSFGSKIDAIPGRLNEDWFKVEKEGVYYGQCSELCGKDHAFMPIMVKAVPQAEFDAWIETAKTAGVEEANKQLAARETAARLAAAAPQQ